MKIIGIGNALVDVLIRLNNDEIVHKLGYPKGSMQLIGSDDIAHINEHTKLLPSQMVSGGSAANTIHGLARLGVHCGYIGCVGKDELGDFYKSEFNALNIDSKLRSSTAETGRALSMISPDSERTFATFLGAAIDLQDSDIDPSFLKKFNLIHLEGYLVQNTTLIEHAMKVARDLGLKISLDLASYNVVEANFDFLERVLPLYVDIVFANEDEAKAFTGKEPEEAVKVLASKCSTAVIKIGKKGSLIQSGKSLTQIPIDPVHSIDTTGAGDQYAAGFLYGYSKNLPPEKCGRLGSILAGTVVQHIGARIPDNAWTHVREMVEKVQLS
jgi:sugar/nucleoside kinase (ribokinase family)